MQDLDQSHQSKGSLRSSVIWWSETRVDCVPGLSVGFRISEPPPALLARGKPRQGSAFLFAELSPLSLAGHVPPRASRAELFLLRHGHVLSCLRFCCPV
jgi:hypothetical protein